MSTKKIVTLFIATFVVVFGATVSANLVTDSFQNQGAEARQQDLQTSIDQVQAFSILFETKLDQFFTSNGFTAEDMALFGNALALARPCTETRDCSLYGEWELGLPNYHAEPYVLTVSPSHDSVYKIIPVETVFSSVDSYPNPRLVVFHISRGGIVTKVMEDGTVMQNWCAGWECGWHQIDDPESAQRIRRNALLALTEG